MNGSTALQPSLPASAACQPRPAYTATEESGRGSAEQADSASVGHRGTLAWPNARASRGTAMARTFQIAQRQPGESPPERDACRVAAMRRLTRTYLNWCGLPELVDDATLIVSELVTNAIQHGNGAQVTFTMTVCGNVLRLVVHNETPGRPAVRDADDDAERGRGLFLVNCLAASHGGTWGTSDGGATTWCRLAVPGGQP